MKNKLEEKVAKNLILFRKKLGLSQRQFALKADIKPNHLNKIENLVMGLSFSNLEKISETYKVPPKLFFEFKEKEDKESSLEQEATMILLKGIKEKWKLKVISTLLWELHSSSDRKV